jgi:acyl-CoA thioester hydrolase
MTNPWIESCRGGVPAWEVDHVGHFTVAYYHQRIEDAGFVVLDALGLGPASARAEGRGCVTAGCYVRYVNELRGGDIYHVQSGVLGIEESALVVGHRLFDSASGTLCTTVEQRLAHVDTSTGAPLALAAASRRAAEAHRVDWPEPPAERRPRPRGEEGFVDGALDTVKPAEMNVLGRSALSHYIHRFSASGGHLLATFGMTPAYMRTEQRGLSTFEFQLTIDGALRPGDIIAPIITVQTNANVAASEIDQPAAGIPAIAMPDMPLSATPPPSAAMPIGALITAVWSIDSVHAATLSMTSKTNKPADAYLETNTSANQSMRLTSSDVGLGNTVLVESEPVPIGADMFSVPPLDRPTA